MFLYLIIFLEMIQRDLELTLEYPGMKIVVMKMRLQKMIWLLAVFVTTVQMILQSFQVAVCTRPRLKLLV